MNKELVAKAFEVKKMYEEAGAQMTYLQMVNELKDYRPEDEHWTGMQEIKFIRDFFGLYTMSEYEMQNLRDTVMLVFTAWERKYDDFNEKMELVNARNSITAVIDDMMFNRFTRERLV